MPNILEKYQNLRNQINTYSETLTRHEQEDTQRREEYQKGYNYYRDRAYQVEDLDLQNGFNNVLLLIGSVERAFERFTQDRDPSNNVTLEEKRRHEHDLKEASNVFLEEINRAVDKGIEAFQHMSIPATFYKRGIMSAFCQEVKCQLDDAQATDILQHLETIQHNLQEIGNTSAHEKSEFYNRCLFIKNSLNPDESDGEVLNNPTNQSETFLRILNKYKADVDLLSKSKNVHAYKVANYIVDCDHGLFDFNVFFNDVKKLRQDILDTPTVANVHPAPTPTPTPASAPSHNTSATITPPKVNGATPSHSGAPQ